MDGERVLVDFDDAEVSDDALVVRGSLPAGTAVRLDVRRYKSMPGYAGIEVMGVTAKGSAGEGQRFALRLDLGGVWGRDGIEVVGASNAVRFDRPERY